jgi:hypothetical protein
MERVPFVLVYGDKEAAGDVLSVRARGKGVQEHTRAVAFELIQGAAKL